MHMSFVQGKKSTLALILILILSIFVQNYYVVACGIVFMYFSIFEFFSPSSIHINADEIKINNMVIRRGKVSDVKLINFLILIVFIKVDNKYRVLIDSWGYGAKDVRAIYSELVKIE